MSDHFIPPDPTQVVPGYETDLSAVGTNRVADPALVATEQHWSEVHPEIAAALAAMPDGVAE